jgi:hypothetical protein
MSAIDNYSNRETGLSDTPSRAFEITPHDTNELSNVTRALYVGGLGDVAVVTAGGDEVTFASVSPGTYLPLRVKQVKATGTEATDIIGVY